MAKVSEMKLSHSVPFAKVSPGVMEMKHSKERDLENLFVSTWVIMMPHILTASANNHVEEELPALSYFCLSGHLHVCTLL